MIGIKSYALASAFAITALAGAVVSPAPAQAATKAPKAPAAPKLNLSKPFQAAAAPASKAIEVAKTRADVIAAGTAVTNARNAYNQARGSTARAQAKTAYDASLASLKTAFSPEYALLETAAAAITSPDDKFTFGQLAVGLGVAAQDSASQRRGISSMLDSGKTPAADVPKYNFFVGQIAFDQGDYVGARAALQTAVNAGYTENDAQALLAEAFIADKQEAQGLAVLQQAIDSRNATANKAPAQWYRRGLGAAYKAKLLDQAVGFSTGLVKAFPTTENWAGAITVVREIGKFPSQETLDLMRLMGRTNSFQEERDYIEYIQAADARRLPGEVLKVVEGGLAAGKLRAADTFVSEARTIANGRLAADKASLAGLEREARGANATGITVSGAADAFLSYGDAAKAEALYNIALGKTGTNMPQLLTRLGIAQLDQGNYAGAQATFAKITGSRKLIAQLWSTYAAQKAAPVTP